MNNNVCFKSKWFDKCIRNYLEIEADEPITEEVLAPIKYLYVSTTHGYELAFGKKKLPKDLRVEHGLTLEQLAEQTHLSKSALGSYEAKDFKDISHYALIKLVKFYGVTADYLLGLSETKNHHSNADLVDLRLSDDMMETGERRKT